GADVRLPPHVQRHPLRRRRARRHDHHRPAAAAERARPRGVARARRRRATRRRRRAGARAHRPGLWRRLLCRRGREDDARAPRAAELLLLGDLVDGERAERIGLVHRAVAPDALDAEVASLAERLADGPPVATALTKASLARALDADLAAALECECAAQAIASKT